MASFKALCLAGVASLVVTATAHSADLLPPAPPIYAPAPAPVIGSGWYLRGDGGIGINDLRTKTSTFDSYVPDARYEGHSLTDSGFIDAGIGYRFNEFFRVDGTGEYRTAAHYSAIESYNQGYFNNPQDNSRSYDTYSASVRSVVGLVNGYVNTPSYYGVSLFAGAGVGVANVKVSNLYDIGPNGGFGFANDHDKTNFAWALMAGLDFAVTNNLTLELGYRYLNLGSVSTGAIACTNTGGCPYEVQHYKLQANDIRLGFRYTFANLLVPPPVIAKY